MGRRTRRSPVVPTGMGRASPIRAAVPFEGHPLTGPFAQRSLGPVVPPVDPAYAASAPEVQRSRAGVIYRDIPLVTMATSWGVADVRAALEQLVQGLFELPAQLCDSI